MPDHSDPFFEPYSRDEVAYGHEPSAALRAMLEQAGDGGEAVDLGAGAGRDTIALAKAGYDVTAVDLSEQGLQRVKQRAVESGVGNRVRTLVADVRKVTLSADRYTAIVATTVLDHLPADDAWQVWKRVAAAVAKRGFLYAEVHTTEDPGSGQMPGRASEAPVSETADAVINYFAPNQLAQWASMPQSRLRVLRYEERLEWDYTHGPEHLHGKAVLLAVREGYHPTWFGQPRAFPRRGE